MESQVKWLGKMAFEATTPEGHKVIMDATPEAGGENRGPKPTELILQALAGCTGIDIVLTLQKMRLDLTGFDLQVTGERAEHAPRYFTGIHIHYKLQGSGLTPEKVERAINLSLDKYCSVAHTLKSKISYTYEIS